MSEDDYTGKLFDDDDLLSHLGEGLVGVHELDPDELFFTGEEVGDDMVITVSAVADGATSFQDAAERLYDLADELLAFAAEGWEIIDEIANGQGAVVRFDVEEPSDG